MIQTFVFLARSFSLPRRRRPFHTDLEEEESNVSVKNFAWSEVPRAKD
jgi:hypothetical protein